MTEHPALGGSRRAPFLLRRSTTFVVALGLAFGLGLGPRAILAASPASDPLLDATQDELLQQAFLPSPRNVHGELRWLRRGDAYVLQTLLYSPQLRRGIQRMRRKELSAWPEQPAVEVPGQRPGHVPGQEPGGVPGAADSPRYLADLEAMRDRALESFARRVDVGETRQMMAVELVLSPKRALWAVFDLVITDGAAGTPARIASRAVFRVTPASREYVRRAIEVQSVEGFGAPPPDLAKLP